MISSNLLDRLAHAEAARKKLQSDVITTEKDLEREVEHAEVLVEAQRLITEEALLIQRYVHSRISRLVTRCLACVFEDEAYEFEIRFNSKRSSTEAEIVLTRDGLEADPLTAAGGGVVDVVSFALRLACLLLQRKDARKLLILDEPFRFVSVEYRSRVVALLETLASEYGVQIIMVTHIDELRLGKVVELRR